MSGGPRRAGDADAGGIGVAIDGAGRTVHAGLRMEYPLRGVPELLLGQILLALAVLFLATYLTAAALSKLRIPGILGALLVAMAAHGTPLARLLSDPAVAPVVEFLGNLAVLFLLFFIGLQIDVREMRSSSRDVALLTVLNTVPPFLLGIAAALVMGYGWVVAFVVGLTRMPTAEAVIVPILDEFGLIRTRVGRFIVGTGVLDDVIEVFLIAFVSVWIGERTATSAAAQGLVENEILRIALGAIAFVAAAWIAHRFLLRRLAGWLPRRPRNLVLLSMIVLFGAGGIAEYVEIGLVVGAIVAGMLLRPVYDHLGAVGEQTTAAIQATTYGFFAVVFFTWVGLSVDLAGLWQAPTLAILLFLAAFGGKLGGVLLMVPMGRLTLREAVTIGIGINARLTTEIVVAKLLLDAGLIDLPLFTALVAASSLSTILVPLLFAFFVGRWRGHLAASAPANDAPESTHAP